MKEKEIIKQFEKMTRSAKELIDKGAEKAAFMTAIPNVAADLVRDNPSNFILIEHEAKKAIQEIAAYKGAK